MSFKKIFDFLSLGISVLKTVGESAEYPKLDPHPFLSARKTLAENRRTVERTMAKTARKVRCGKKTCRSKI